MANREAGEQPWFSELKMVRGEKITGRLVDENQRPVAGAHLRCDSSPKSGNDWERSSHVHEVSDQDGRFAVVVPYDGITNLSIIPTGDCMKFVEIGQKRGDLGDIVLEPGFPIQGVVKNAKGQPMEGVWVNITPQDVGNGVSYEMKRSSKTDDKGQFTTRPVKSGKYLVRGRIESAQAAHRTKQKYANFHERSFVCHVRSADDQRHQGFGGQAVRRPSGTARADQRSGLQTQWRGHERAFAIPAWRIRWAHESGFGKGKETGEGALPRNDGAARRQGRSQLHFITNEHSALMVQFEDGKPSPQDDYRFAILEEDINNIRVVRYAAAILKIRAVDESGADLKNAGIFANYAAEKDATDEMMMGKQIGYNREGGFLRLSSIVPNTEFMVRLRQPGFEDETRTFTMNEGERRNDHSDSKAERSAPAETP